MHYFDIHTIYMELCASCKGFQNTMVTGSAKNKIPKIRDYYGSGWVGPGLTRNCYFFLENRPKISINQW